MVRPVIKWEDVAHSGSATVLSQFPLPAAMAQSVSFLTFVGDDGMEPTVRTGDMVGVDTESEIRPGDIVIAHIDRFSPPRTVLGTWADVPSEEDLVLIEFANPDHPSMVLPREMIRVIGTIVFAYRLFRDVLRDN